MIGMTIAASLGFAFGASFKMHMALLHGAIAAASGAATYAVVMESGWVNKALMYL